MYRTRLFALKLCFGRVLVSPEKENNMAGQIEKYIKERLEEMDYKLSTFACPDPSRSYFKLKITIANRIRCAVANGNIS